MGSGHRCAGPPPADTLVRGTCWHIATKRGVIEVPRYLVERTFPDSLGVLDPGLCS